MNKILLAIVLSLFGINSYGQETFKKKYYIPNTILFKNDKPIHLQKDSLISYENLTDSEKNEFRNDYKNLKYITKTEEVIINNKKSIITKDVVIDSIFYRSLSKSVTKNVMDNNIRGFVKFEEDGKLYVNRYLRRDALGNHTRFGSYYYKLQNRQTVQLYFNEISVSAIIIPIKYRFKGENDLSEDFSTSVNGNIFVGYTIGKTNFFHQEKVGNKSNTSKFTAGLLFGASSVILDKNNTSKANFPILDDKKITKGLANLGFGMIYTFNKINFGVFYGYDYAIGDESEKWNYNKKPWLGVAIGYSLLNL